MPRPGSQPPMFRYVKHGLFAPRLELHYLDFQYLSRSLTFAAKNSSRRPESRRSRFACYVMLYLPDVAETIDDGDFGLLHLEVGRVRLATHRAILARDWDTVRNHFAFMNVMFRHAGPELTDAVNVSYLGMLFYDEPSLQHTMARTLLPSRLRTRLAAIERHYDSLAATNSAG